ATGEPAIVEVDAESGVVEPTFSFVLLAPEVGATAGLVTLPELLPLSGLAAGVSKPVRDSAPLLPGVFPALPLPSQGGVGGKTATERAFIRREAGTLLFVRVGFEGGVGGGNVLSPGPDPNCLEADFSALGSRAFPREVASFFSLSKSVPP